jgi:hypothetical protein
MRFSAFSNFLQGVIEEELLKAPAGKRHFALSNAVF